MNQEQQSQTTEYIRDNIVKIVDRNGEFFGSGFFIEVKQQIYCISCHHCIYTLDDIFVEGLDNRYQAKWMEEYSNMKQDVAVLRVEDSKLRPLIYSREAMANFPVTIRGFSGERIKSLPRGTSGRDSSLSDSFTPFEVEKGDAKGSNKWNKKPAVYVNVYECEGKFDLGFSGSPVYYRGPNKVVGIFTAKDDNFGYVIPIQTLLDKFEGRDILKPQEPKDTVKILEEGNKLYFNDNFNEAIQCYNQVISDPNNLTALSNKGKSLVQLGKNDQALKLFQLVLDIDNNFMFALNGMAMACINLRHYSEAIKWLERALTVDPSYVDALNNMGLVLNDWEKYEEAIKWYDKALAINPNHINALNNKGVALDNLGKYEEAIKWYDKALAIHPEAFSILNNKKNLEKKLGRKNV